LTTDLVRARLRQGRIYPRYLDVTDPEWIERAAVLKGLFEDHVGCSLGALEEAISALIGDETDFQVRRGLVKLLMDETTTEVLASRPPPEIRGAVFRAAAAQWPVIDAPTRESALTTAAEELGITSQEVADGLYADLRSHEVITASQLPEVLTLLNRYNLALVQAILLRARRVRVTLPDARPARARQLFRIAKFHRLMHRAERREGGDGWELILDGPASLFKATQRYGLQLALFLPALCHCERWSLSADVTWGPQKLEVVLELDHKSGLVSHTKERGTWESEEERHFRASFKRLKTPWVLRRSTRIVALDGRGVLVPDYVLTHPDGRTALLELVWFWRRRAFEDRLALLRSAGPANLVVAYAARMNTGPEDLPALDGVVGFKGVIQPKRIIEACERIAT
jgi:predicted nuclease of restriction endonuclease-like RecB superfamily